MWIYYLKKEVLRARKNLVNPFLYPKSNDKNSPFRDPNSTLLEKEIDDEETEMRYSQPQCNQVHVRPHGIKALTQTPLMDEEDDIEEFEDD